MFSFTKKQEVFDISGIKIGGQPGIYSSEKHWLEKHDSKHRKLKHFVFNV